MLPPSIPLKCELHARHAQLDLLAQILAETTGNEDWREISEWLFANPLPDREDRWAYPPHTTLERALVFTESHPNPMITRLGWDFWCIARTCLGRATAHPLYFHVRDRWEKRPLTPIFKKELEHGKAE